MRGPKDTFCDFIIIDKTTFLSGKSMMKYESQFKFINTITELLYYVANVKISTVFCTSISELFFHI